ncbi:MAG TPA: NAD-dependent epimerase/dehydratase family protein [Acidimicrobiia bacterium]|nr:NAD-dependent epimerase/dehydratase family protein [Acidimicrobiia bacterium]
MLVTGATGVVGGAVLRHLLAANLSVRALVRPGRELPVEVEAAMGDVLDYESVLAACRGVEVVYHLAGINRMCQPRPEEMYRVNVDGTRHVVRACRSAGVRRLVYTSSAATIGEPRGAVGNEDTAHRGSFHSHYERSKYQAEQMVVSEASDLDYVIVNPSSVQGPGRATGTGKLLLDVINGRLPWLVDTTISVVDIDDCARGHLLAAERGERGRRYLLNSFTTSVRQAVQILREVTGRKLNAHFLPMGLVSALAPALWLPLSLMRRRAPICPEMVRTLRHGHAYDGGRATRELGLVYTEPEETLRKLYEWASRQGLVSWVRPLPEGD